jgi:hypothetical protein
MKALVLCVLVASLYGNNISVSDCNIIKNNVKQITIYLINPELNEEEFINVAKTLKREMIYSKSSCFLSSKEKKSYNELLLELRDF